VSYSSGKIDQVRLEDLAASEKAVGQIYPVVKDANPAYRGREVTKRWGDRLPEVRRWR